MVVLSCIALSAACDGAGIQMDEPLGNTELTFVIADPDSEPDELAFSIDYVSYRINCPSSGEAAYDDSVTINGSFEVVDDGTPPIWELVTDLPPAMCSVTLWVFYDDEVVCSGSQSMQVIEDGDPSTTNKFNIVLECSLSVNPPSGDATFDGSFDFVHGNYCPQLFWLGSYPSTDPFVMNIQTSSIDVDTSCGQNCDPQTCDFTTAPPVCTPGPDNGLTSTLSAPALKGSFGDVTASDTIYTCDWLYPGPTEICVLVSDGDLECDQTRCVTIDCPDVCENVDCDDGNECTRDRCNPITGACSNILAPDGIACDSCNSTCQAGVCDPSVPFTADQVSSNLIFVGTIQPVTATLFNPYSGYSTFINGSYRVNTSSYMGIGNNDVLTGTNQGDMLLVQDPLGTQRICGVEVVTPLNSFDVMFLADSFITLQDMTIEGGDAGDLLWANSGNDTIRGFEGNDLIDGGPGDDDIDGGLGDDTITLWPGSGFDTIAGGAGSDQVEIRAVQSQITMRPAADLGNYQVEIDYLGTPMALVASTEFIVLDDAVIDLLACAPFYDCDFCGNDALNGGEECDDGNNLDGDGCAADCSSEY